jgi:hypothetical protein
MSETGAREDCQTCKKRVACEQGLAYSESNPFRFKDFKDIAFDFCPYLLAEDTGFSIYYSQVWALQYGVNTFGDSLTLEELDCLLILTQMRAKLIERRYMEFWAKALGGKK